MMDGYVMDGKKAGSYVYYRGDGYHYHFNNGSTFLNGQIAIVNLRCSNYYKRLCCGTAKIETLPDGQVRWTNLKRHTCVANHNHTAVMTMRQEILRDATNQAIPFEAPANLVHRVAERYPDHIAVEVSSDRMRSSIHRARRQLYPPVPVSLYELMETLSDAQHEFITQCLGGEDNFFAGTVQGPNGLTSIIFMSRRMRRYLNSGRVKIAFCDGTFGSRPNSPQSSQVLQIVAVLNSPRGNACLPLAQIVMTGKSEAEYIAVLQRFRELVPRFRPRLVVTDFELALQNAWRQVFNVRITGCYWHYCRAILLKAKDLGLTPLMNQHPQLKSLVRCFCAIPLLPQGLILRGVNVLIREATRDGWLEVLEEFIHYFIDTWTSAPFLASLSVYNVRHRTNNVCESCNKLLRSHTGAHRPGLYQFIGALRKFEHNARLILQRHEMGLRVNRKIKASAINNNRRIRNFTHNLLAGHLSISRFLHLASTRVLGIFDRFIA